LLAPNPINEINGQSSTNLKLQFNQTIKKILEIIKNFDNVKVIVKLHPIQLQHNEEIKLFIKNLDSSIPIYLWTPIIETINNVDAVLVLTPEIHATPTMLLESMILGKPTMNVYFDKKIPEYDHIKNNAVFTITHNENLENNLKKFLFDNDFKNLLQKNADNFVNQFMSNPGTASKKFASILKSY
jgi:UDP-N-acetylglucosamine 2-epimerase